MRKIIYLTIFFLFYSCQKKNNDPINIVKIKKEGNLLVMDIENNSIQDYYILNPELGLYTMGGASMIETVLITPHLRSTKTDSVICEIFVNDCILHERLFSQVVTLPKKKITRLKYKYLYSFDESKVKYIPIFPYNINQLEKDSMKVKVFQLQKKLDENNILGNYKVYIKEIK